VTGITIEITVLQTEYCKKTEIENQMKASAAYARNNQSTVQCAERV